MPGAVIEANYDDVHRMLGTMQRSLGREIVDKYNRAELPKTLKKTKTAFTKGTSKHSLVKVTGLTPKQLSRRIRIADSKLRSTGTASVGIFTGKSSQIALLYYNPKVKKGGKIVLRGKGKFSNKAVPGAFIARSRFGWFVGERDGGRARGILSEANAGVLFESRAQAVAEEMLSDHAKRVMDRLVRQARRA